MRCRELKIWYDENKDKKSNLLWFGSYGKIVIAKKQEIDLLKDYTLLDTIKKQTFYLNLEVTGITNENASTTINFYNTDGEIIDYFVAYSNGVYKLKGTLNSPLSSISINKSDFKEAILILNEYAESRLNKITTIIDDKKEEKVISFVEGKEAVLSSLIENLSVLQGELWYNVLYGQPIIQKDKSKILIDSYISKIIYSNLNVNSIDSFNSYIKNNQYFCDIVINTIYGNIEINTFYYS